MRILLFLLILASGTTACHKDTQPTPSEVPDKSLYDAPTQKEDKVVESNKDAESGVAYSPFVVEILDDATFKMITFKDVGMGRDSAEPNDPLLEALAESLSHELSLEPKLSLATRVDYDETWLSEHAHRECHRHHIYVDIWRPSESRWGYSLWSGCSEDDQFAWKELDNFIDPLDTIELVKPLTRSIVSDIAEATESSCFTKFC